jgi:hypothetical protein
MVLSEDLLTPRGKVILPKGATLTDVSLASLRRYEVETLPIELSDELSAAEEAAELAQLQERIIRLFRKSTDDKAAMLLQQYVTLFRLGPRP